MRRVAQNFAVRRGVIVSPTASSLVLTGLPMPPIAHGAARSYPARYHAWRSAASWQVRLQGARRVRGSVAIAITLEEGASRVDLGALAKAPIDLLCELQLIEGDHREVIREVSLRWGQVRGLRIDVRSAP